ncbi:zinc finger, CCHC-type containing protein [Tanacetum coccineum]|uniref:Zinc finger, CCHC-type containing protein n=1 Tax=Tanacetum coccineum TaxID=301880 RepID=A0ABQ5ACP7_9ASTR
MPELVEVLTVEAIRIRANIYECRIGKGVWGSLNPSTWQRILSSKKFLTGHFKRDCRSGKKKHANAGGSGKGSKDQSQDQGQNLVNVWNSFVKYSVSLISEAFYVQFDAIAWWIDSGCLQLMFCIIHENYSPTTTTEKLYLVEGSRDQVGSQYSYCYSIEEDPRTYNEAMQSRDAAFWKEAIDDEIGSIMENNTWCYICGILPLVANPLVAIWILKRKMKVDGTIDKFKARLVIQGFRQKEGIDYFDTYAPVARITTIRLLLALAAIHNLVIHQMDVKTAFLNGDLDEEVYMKQPEGFVMPGNEHKVCKLVKSLYGLKQAPKQWHQKFDEVVLSSGFHLNQSDKCVYSKFDNSGKGVIICLYVDDMLIFGTDQNQVDKTKKFLSSRFSMKDMGEADIILGIKIKRENKGIVITQSQYIEKILKKFNREDCSPVSTPMDPVEKLKPNTWFTSNPSRQHWKVITRMFKYLRGTKDYGLSYVGYPLVLEGYSDASWINHVEDSSSTSGWVFGSLPGKEAEWLRNLIHEIPIWPKLIAPISIRCDSAPTMARAYSQIYNGESRHWCLEHMYCKRTIRKV